MLTNRINSTFCVLVIINVPSVLYSCVLWNDDHKEAFPNYKYRLRKCGRELKRTTAITSSPEVTIPYIMNFIPAQTPPPTGLLTSPILLFSNLEDLDFYLNNFYSNFYSPVISQILSIIYSDINFFLFSLFIRAVFFLISLFSQI